MLNEAYETLSDPEMRSSYNARLQVALADQLDDYSGEVGRLPPHPAAAGLAPPAPAPA
jgi:curved DNA-binding protein CbpA